MKDNAEACLQLTFRSTSVIDALRQLWFLIKMLVSLVFKGHASMEIPVSPAQLDGLIRSFEEGRKA